MITKRILMLLVFLVLVVPSVSAANDFVDLDEYLVEYSYAEDNAESGERFTLKVTLTNQDDRVREDIKFEIDEGFPFEIRGEDDFKLDSLGVDESKTKTFRVEVEDTARDEEYELDFSLEDKDDDYDDFFIIEVNSNKPELIIGNIESSPSVITPDTNDVQLKLNLENIGGGDAEFVRVELKLPNGITPSSSYSNTANLGTIQNGGSKEVSFFVDTVEILEGRVYMASLDLVYEDEDSSSVRETLEFEIPLKGKPQFIVQGVTLTPKLIYPGSEVKVGITVRNVGQEEGKETSIRVFEKSDQPFEFDEKTKFIGSIDENLAGSAVFNLNVDKDAEPNTYLLSIQTRTVNEGTVLVIEDTIPLTISKNAEGSGNGMLQIVFLLLLVAFILLIVFRNSFNKRKRYYQ